MTLRKASRENMKAFNRRMLLDVVRTKQPIHRSQLSQLTRLSKATVSSLMEEFNSQGLVRYVGVGESESGRKPLMIEFDGSVGYIVGIELADHIRFMCVDLSMQVRHHVDLDFRINQLSQEDVAVFLHDLIQGQLKLLPQSRYGMMGIGITVLGFVHPVNQKIIRVSQFNWEELDLATPLRDAFGVPVLVDNRSNAAALGEVLFGVANNCDAAVYVNVGQGIGVGIVLNGQLYRGVSGYAGEVTHTPLFPGGDECECGMRGCWGAYVIERVIRSRLAQRGIALESGGPSVFAQMAAYLPRNKTVHDVTQELGHHLGMGLVGIVNLLNPKIIILGGEIVHIAGWVIDPIKETLQSRCHASALEIMNITTPKEPELALVRGACALPVDKVFEGIASMSSPTVISKG